MWRIIQASTPGFQPSSNAWGVSDLPLCTLHHLPKSKYSGIYYSVTYPRDFLPMVQITLDKSSFIQKKTSRLEKFKKRQVILKTSIEFSKLDTKHLFVSFDLNIPQIFLIQKWNNSVKKIFIRLRCNK